MTLTVSLVLDIVIAAVLVYCFVLGVRRGLILTLCSLLAVLLALVGGWYLSTHYAAPLQEKLEPVLVEKLAHQGEDPAAAADQPETDPPPLPERFLQAVQERMIAAGQSAVESTTAAWAAAIAALLAKSILFLAGFLAVLLVWTVLCRVLDLVARLPGLHLLNKVLGGAVGLVKGVLILMVARWALCDLLGWIGPDVIAESRLLPYLTRLPIFSLLGG